MIKRLFILGIVVLLMMPQLAVYADLIMGNEFLYKNEDKTEKVGEGYSGKRFVVNSPVGYVIPQKEPGSEEGVSAAGSYKGTSPGGHNDKPYTYEGDVFIFENGEVIRITNTYLHAGKYWGVMGLSHTYQPPGWIPMDELLMLYTSEDWEEENSDKFYTYTGSYDVVLSAEKLVIWQWPGSDREKIVVDKPSPSHYANYHSSSRGDYTYMDDAGREWGYAGYEGWFCLSDPENKTKIPAFNPAPPPQNWSPDGSNGWFLNNMNLLIYSTLFVLIVGMTVLIWVFRKKSRPKQGGESND